jgi:hypothetical protein
MLIAYVMGGVVAALAVLALALFQPQRSCPQCGTPLLRFRRPRNLKQTLWGGWTCPACGVETDRQGRRISG